jgi:hypothetical protein
MVQGERIRTPTAHRRAVYSRLDSLVSSPWLFVVSSPDSYRSIHRYMHIPNGPVAHATLT